MDINSLKVEELKNELKKRNINIRIARFINE